MEALGWLNHLACFFAYTTFFTTVLMFFVPSTSIRDLQLLKLKAVVSDIVSESIERDPNNIKAWRFIQTRIRLIPTTSADLTISYLFTELERLVIYPTDDVTNEIKWSSMRLHKRLQDRLKSEITRDPELVRLFIPKVTFVQWIDYGLYR